jgi:glycerol kinase
MPELILALDVGTTTARAAVFGPGADLKGLAAAPVHSISPAPGRVEQDPQAIWRSARRVMSQALALAGAAPHDIAAIGVTTQRASVMVWDRRTGAPLTPLVVWSDLRGAARAAELRAGGFFVSAQQAAAKLEAVMAAVEAPGIRLAVGNIDSYLIFRLSGGEAHVTDRSQAWPMGYLDLASLGWSTNLLAHQGLDPDLLPTLDDTFGPMAETSARVFGAAVPICADVADQSAALMAHGAMPGTAKVTFGTSATLDLDTGEELTFRGPAAPPLIVSSVGGETRFCVEAMVISGGAALDWLRGAARLGSHAAFEALAARVPDAGGAAFLPALQGLGAPHGDPDRRGLLAGLSPGVTRAHIARAGLEGVAFRVREAAALILGEDADGALNVDGGLTGNATFLQILADLLARPVRRHALAEATAAGAAMCAGRGAGLLSDADLAAFTRYDREFAPTISAEAAAERFSAWARLVHGIDSGAAPL